MNKISVTFCFYLFLLPFQFVQAEEIRVAVAANFTSTFKLLAQKFEAKTKHSVLVSSGSSGNHYAQILNGAPFDLFLSADSHRPKKLEEENKIVPGSRFTYALGKLVLWSADTKTSLDDGKILKSGSFKHLSLANPRFAPYGVAAEEVLKALGLWKQLQPRLVKGENISQAFQFAKSGNAELGFVSLAQVLALPKDERGTYWSIPTDMYRPIEQQVVQLKDTSAANSLLLFLRQNESQKLIKSSGYEIP